MNINDETTTYSVIRQALVEYISARYCLSRSALDGLQMYVDKRYADHDENFRTKKKEWLKSRIEKAFQLIENLDNEKMEITIT